MESYILYCRRINSAVKKCVTNAYGKIRYELPFIGALCVDVPVDNKKALSSLTGVWAVSEDMKVTKLGDSHPCYSCTKQGSKELTGRGVSIAILDTGVAPHYDLIKPYNRILFFKDYVNHRYSPYDDDGHGTHVAGIAAGNGYAGIFTGVAPEASVISLKVLDSAGSGNASDILAAMQWVCDNCTKYNIRVVNLSLGMAPKKEYIVDPMQLGVKAMTKLGLTVIAACGNSGPAPKSISSPGTSPYAITVGCCNEKGVSSFSSRGPVPGCKKPDIVANGEDVISLFPTKSDYSSQSGTSMSAPLVSGAAACLYSAYPFLSCRRLKSLLLSMSEPFPDECENAQGAGRFSWKNNTN